MMKKTKLLTIAVLVLVMINLVTLSFFISKEPGDGPGRKAMPREIIIEKLRFDVGQITKYDQLIEVHRDSVRLLDRKIKDNKNTLYNQLAQPYNQKSTEALFLQLATSQATIEKLHYNHFLAIKSLCKPDQLDDYDNLTNELAKIFNPKHPPQHPNHAP